MSPYTTRKTSVKICEYLVVSKVTDIDQLHSKKPQGLRPQDYINLEYEGIMNLTFTQQNNKISALCQS